MIISYKSLRSVRHVRVFSSELDKNSKIALALTFGQGFEWKKIFSSGYPIVNMVYNVPNVKYPMLNTITEQSSL